MKIQEYAALREEYQMPDEVECAGNAVDRETGAWLSIGARIHRDTYQKTGYLCRQDASETFHACVCSLLRQIQDMPVIKTVLLTPEMVLTPLCEEGEAPTEEMRYAASMALSALRQTLRGYIATRPSPADRQL